MRTALVALCLVVAVGGRETTPNSTNLREHATVGHRRNAVASVLGTPFYLAFKGAICAASAATAGPVAGVTALSDSYFAPKIQRDLGNGIKPELRPRASC